MKVAFSAKTDISIYNAKLLVAKQYPELVDKIKNISTKTELEQFLIAANYVLFVNYDPAADYAKLLIKEEQEKIIADASIDECPLPPTPFVEEDLEDYCQVDIPGDEANTPIPIVTDADIAAIEQAAKKIAREKDGGLSEGLPLNKLDGAIGEAMACVENIRSISDSLKPLLVKEQFVKQTVVNIEQLYYHYRILEAYYVTKLNRLDSLIDEFGPLLREKRQIDEKIRLLDIALTTAEENAEFDIIDIINVGGALNEDQTVITLNIEKALLVQQLGDVQKNIDNRRAGIWSFNMAELQEGTTENRLSALSNALSLIGPGGDVFNNVSAFSTNIKLEPVQVGDTYIFSAVINHQTIDFANIFNGYDMSFALPDASVVLDNYPELSLGVLYDRLYNIWGDPYTFFTLEERGLTFDSTAQDPTIGDTTLTLDGLFIKDMAAYKAFYGDFIKYHEAKVQLIKESVIEPAIADVTAVMKNIANKEIELLLSFGGIYAVLPAESFGLLTLIDSVRLSANMFMSKIQACANALSYAKEQHGQVLKEIEQKKSDLKNVPCAKNFNPEDDAGCGGDGGDPLGLKMGEEDPNAPNFTKYCYWLKFAGMATIAGLTPIPGPGGLKYWPVGLTVPSPAGLVKIPLPVIWIPLATIVLPVGILVIFLGQCGICPSPVVFFVGPDGEKKFIVSMRPGEQFGQDSALPLIKTVDMGGFAIPFPDSELLSGNVPGFNIDIPGFNANQTILDDIKVNIINGINKIPNMPDTAALRNLTANADMTQKKNALKKVASDWIGGLEIPDIRIPKDSKKANPTTMPIMEAIDQLKLYSKMKLPEIAIPPMKMIDLTKKLKLAIRSIDIASLSIPSISIPSIPDIGTSLELPDKVKDALKKIADSAVTTLMADVLALFPILSGGAEFANPMICCRQTNGGIMIPPIPPIVQAALEGIKLALIGSIDGLANGDVINMLKSYYGPNTPNNITIPDMMGMLTKTLESMVPPFIVPDPSNLSIKDLSASAATMLASMQIPSIPSGIPAPQITIPGSVLTAAIREPLLGLLMAIDPGSLAIPIPNMSAIDIKQLVLDIIEDVLQQLEGTIQPFLSIISAMQSIKGMTFGQMLGLMPVLNFNLIPMITPAALLAAQAVLSVLGFIPYPVVLMTKPLFMKMHPLLTHDDMPPWERLSLQNFLFVCFLDDWCTQGKKTCGLFENP